MRTSTPESSPSLPFGALSDGSPAGVIQFLDYMRYMSFLALQPLSLSTIRSLSFIPFFAVFPPVSCRLIGKYMLFPSISFAGISVTCVERKSWWPNLD